MTVNINDAAAIKVWCTTSPYHVLLVFKASNIEVIDAASSVP